jgi:hypothetical protein
MNRISFRNIFLLILSPILYCFFSCSSKSNDIENKLVGTWTLDSELYVRGGLQKVSGERRVIKFFNDGSYSYEWQQLDVGGTVYGKYFILKNPNRKFYTISFIPDVSKEGFIDYMNYDVISVSDSLLQLAEPSKTILQDDKQSSYIFNGKLIYKRHE